MLKVLIFKQYLDTRPVTSLSGLCVCASRQRDLWFNLNLNRVAMESSGNPSQPNTSSCYFVRCSNDVTAAPSRGKLAVFPQFRKNAAWKRNQDLMLQKEIITHRFNAVSNRTRTPSDALKWMVGHSSGKRRRIRKKNHTLETRLYHPQPFSTRLYHPLDFFILKIR